ncbi:MAG: hypothetical protein WC284_16490 [Candidimonas sp.]
MEKKIKIISWPNGLNKVALTKTFRRHGFDLRESITIVKKILNEDIELIVSDSLLSDIQKFNLGIKIYDDKKNNKN